MATDPAPNPRFDIFGAVRAGLCIWLGFVAARMLTTRFESHWGEFVRISAGALAAAGIAAFTMLVIERRAGQLRDLD